MKLAGSGPLECPALVWSFSGLASTSGRLSSAKNRLVTFIRSMIGIWRCNFICAQTIARGFHDNNKFPERNGPDNDCGDEFLESDEAIQTTPVLKHF